MIGHERVRAALAASLAPVVLLRGPESVGKWTLANHLAQVHRVAETDLMRCPARLDVDTVRAVLAFVATAPFGAFKLVLIELDGASEAALGALLKTLEEPPGTARFVLTSTGPVPATIVSRASVYELGLLSRDELRAVLTGTGMNPAAVDRAAQGGRGQVVPAQAALGADEACRAAVLSVTRAVAQRDPELFERAFAGFDDAARTLLVTGLIEAVTGRWAVFGPGDLCGLHTDRPRLLTMLAAIAAVGAARAQLGVRAALEPFLAPA